MNNELKLSQLIGRAIVAIRYSYDAKNEYGLQEYRSYIKLDNGLIIGFPVYDNEVLMTLTVQNKDYYNRGFNQGKEITDWAKQLIEGQKIADILFCYYDGEVDEEKTAYLKLSNGYYITEKHYGPSGTTDIDLLIFDETEYLKRVRNLKEEVKSYVANSK